MLPPISETQLVMIALLTLLCGAGVGFILGGLWMEKRLKQRQALQVKELRSREEPTDHIGLSA
jgi:hypothetical protein